MKIDFDKMMKDAVTRPDQIKLSGVPTPLKDLPKDMAESLAKLYNFDCVEMRLAATLFNAAFTQQKLTFLLSQRIFADLIEADTNITRNSLDGQTYKRFMTYAKNSGLITEVVRGSIRGEASVFALAHEGVIAAVKTQASEDFFKAQHENVLRVHKSHPTSHLTSHPTSREVVSNEVTDVLIQDCSTDSKTDDSSSLGFFSPSEKTSSETGEAANQVITEFSGSSDSKAKDIIQKERQQQPIQKNPPVAQPPLITTLKDCFKRDQVEALLGANDISITDSKEQSFEFALGQVAYKAYFSQSSVLQGLHEVPPKLRVGGARL